MWITFNSIRKDGFENLSSKHHKLYFLQTKQVERKKVSQPIHVIHSLMLYRWQKNKLTSQTFPLQTHCKRWNQSAYLYSVNQSISTDDTGQISPSHVNENNNTKEWNRKEVCELIVWVTNLIKEAEKKQFTITNHTFTNNKQSNTITITTTFINRTVPINDKYSTISYLGIKW